MVDLTPLLVNYTCLKNSFFVTAVARDGIVYHLDTKKILCESADGYLLLL